MKRAFLALLISAVAPTVSACSYDGYAYGYDRWGGPWRSRASDPQTVMPMHGRSWVDHCMDYDAGMRYPMPDRMMGTAPQALLFGPIPDGLSLSDEQLRRISEIRRQINQQVTTLDTEHATLGGRLRDLQSDPKVSPARIADARRQLTDLQSKRWQTILAGADQVDAVLTDAQRAQWHPRMRGYGW
jgi:hypothetical protein